MFDSTMELITLVSSNSLIIFFICNLIIVTLLLTGSNLDSPPSANYQGTHVQGTHVLQDINSIEKQKKEEEEDQEGENVSLPQTVNRIEKQVKEKEEALEYYYNDIESSSSSSSSQQDIVQASINNDNNEEGFVIIDNNNNSINDDEHEDDDLRKRAEEFIEKINRRWKEEKFGNSQQYLERQNLSSGYTRIPVM